MLAGTVRCRPRIHSRHGSGAACGGVAAPGQSWSRPHRRVCPIYVCLRKQPDVLLLPNVTIRVRVAQITAHHPAGWKTQPGFHKIAQDTASRHTPNWRHRCGEETSAELPCWHGACPERRCSSVCDRGQVDITPRCVAVKSPFPARDLRSRSGPSASSARIPAKRSGNRACKHAACDRWGTETSIRYCNASKPCIKNQTADRHSGERL
jgi:hypothetical protein